MPNSTLLQMPYLEAAQAQKHVTHNDALRVLDGVVQLSVADRDLTTPPGSPSDGDRYIVASSGTGAWSGEDGNVAIWQDGAWAFYAPREGWLCWVEDEGRLCRYTGSAWVDYAVNQPEVGLVSGNGAKLEFKSLSEEVELSGATTASTIAFPNQSLSLGATIRVTEEVTFSGGGTNFAVGDGDSATRYGNGIGVSVGTTNQGIIGPTGYYGSNDEIVFTADAGSFTDGTVLLTIFYMEITPPPAP